MKHKQPLRRYVARRLTWMRYYTHTRKKLSTALIQWLITIRTSEREVWPKNRVSPRGPRVRVPGEAKWGSEGEKRRGCLPNASKRSSSSCIGTEGSILGESSRGGGVKSTAGELEDGLPSEFSTNRGWGLSETAAWSVRSAVSRALFLLVRASILFLRSSTSATACLRRVARGLRTGEQHSDNVPCSLPASDQCTCMARCSSPTRCVNERDVPSGHKAAQPLFVHVSHGTYAAMSLACLQYAFGDCLVRSESGTLVSSPCDRISASALSRTEGELCHKGTKTNWRRTFGTLHKTRGRDRAFCAASACRTWPLGSSCPSP